MFVDLRQQAPELRAGFEQMSRARIGLCRFDRDAGDLAMGGAAIFGKPSGRSARLLGRGCEVGRDMNHRVLEIPRNSVQLPLADPLRLGLRRRRRLGGGVLKAPMLLLGFRAEQQAIGLRLGKIGTGLELLFEHICLHNDGAAEEQSEHGEEEIDVPRHSGEGDIGGADDDRDDKEGEAGFQHCRIAQRADRYDAGHDRGDHCLLLGRSGGASDREKGEPAEGGDSRLNAQDGELADRRVGAPLPASVGEIFDERADAYQPLKRAGERHSLEAGPVGQRIDDARGYDHRDSEGQRVAARGLAQLPCDHFRRTRRPPVGQPPESPYATSFHPAALTHLG